MREVCEAIVEEKMADIIWDEEECKDLSLDLCDEIKERVKALNFSRYKIIVQCTVGENKRQGVLITSRCLWEPSCDNYMSYSFKNDQVWVNVMVFGLYTF